MNGMSSDQTVKKNNRLSYLLSRSKTGKLMNEFEKNDH